MVPIVDIIVSMFLSFAFWIESIFRFFIPQARKNVEGDIVLITGAGSGVGQSLSVEFAKLGCIIVGWDISESGLQETEEKLRNLDLGHLWYSYICDISNRHQVYETAEKVSSDVGNVSILINNAGIVTGKNFLESRDELIIKTMEVNVLAHFWTIKAFLPSMMERNKGHIVTIASAGGMFGQPGLVDYCASKFANVGMAESLFIEMNYAKRDCKIKSTVVCPYYIDTGMFEGVSTPVMPMIKLKDAVDQIVDAVLRDKVILCMPRIVYITYALRGLLPVKSMYVLGMATGTFGAMKTFIGRKKTN